MRAPGLPMSFVLAASSTAIAAEDGELVPILERCESIYSAAAGNPENSENAVTFKANASVLRMARQGFEGDLGQELARLDRGARYAFRSTLEECDALFGIAK